MAECSKKDTLTENESNKPAHQVKDAADQVLSQTEDGLDRAEDGVEDALEDFEDGGDEVGDAVDDAGHDCCGGLGMRVRADAVGLKIWRGFELGMTCRNG